MRFSLSKAEFIQLSNEVRVSTVVENWQAGQDPQFGNQGREGIVNGKGIYFQCLLKRQSKKTKAKVLISFW